MGPLTQSQQLHFSLASADFPSSGHQNVHNNKKMCFSQRGNGDSNAYIYQQFEKFSPRAPQVPKTLWEGMLTELKLFSQLH